VNLATWARDRGPAPIRQACEIVRQAAVGLDALHQAGIVHRNIKPSNLMLTADDTVKILDLGLARLHSESGPGSELTDTGQTMGTADYIAPEQVTNTRHVDIRADIYSLGCTLYKLLTGQAPFSGPGYSNVGAKLVPHVHDAIPPVTTLRPDVPACVSAILDKMIAKAPDQRFANPAELVAALDEVLAQAEWPCLPVQARTQRKPAWQAMQWTKAKIAGVLGGAAALGGGFERNERKDD
jgi:eukaryotic-like serine/threonine-protein kinase